MVRRELPRQFENWIALTTPPALRATSPYTGEARGIEDAAPYKGWQ
nr:MAG TPA: hypothetical protein [Caudoviricetes sp.]